MNDNIVYIEEWLKKYKNKKDISDLDIVIYKFIKELDKQGIDIYEQKTQKDILFIIKFIESLYKRHKGEKSVLHEIIDEWFKKNPNFFLNKS
tara:strand:+ start:575 stop:850 length:276 start_codon:yes stop_codon:yes gene_type:complete